MNTKHYVEIFSKAVDNALPQPDTDISYKSDVLDIMRQRRQEMNQQFQENLEIDPSRQEGEFPAELIRRYTLLFKPRSGTSD